MTTNITSKFLAGTGVIVTTSNTSRIIGIHAYSTVNGTFAIGDSGGDKIKWVLGVMQQYVVQLQVLMVA